MDFIGVTQDRERWRAFVRTVMNFYVSKIRGISCLTESLLACPEKLCSL